MSAPALPIFDVLLMAAGQGSRMGNDIPKQFLRVAGKMLIEHTIDCFASHPSCRHIYIVYSEPYTKTVQTIQKNQKCTLIPHGGNTRKESVFNGLNAISNLESHDFIFIHDAARPYLQHTDIDQCLAAITQAGPMGGVTLGQSITDTVYQKSQGIIDREALITVQTPQCFRYGDIVQAHENANPNKDYTDDSAIFQDGGGHVDYIRALHFNNKVTHSGDLLMAEKLLATQTEIRIGQGYDVHAFETEPTDRKLMLCGIEVEHPYALAGHSDADVGLHALTDALMGALALGDIGRHFPPSDAQYKDMDSAIFLEKTLELLHARGATIINIDLTLICEKPKIAPYETKMRQRIADILQININRVSVKATTSERLGFTGRGEGIAAQACVSVEAPR